MTQNTLWTPSDISNTEAGAEGGEQDSPKRRGRIPQSAWPQILERYRGGATLSAIAREFECTPSAISYIVRKAEASGVTVTQDTDKTTDSETLDQAPATAVEATAVEPPAAAPVPAPTRQPAARRSTATAAPATDAAPRPAAEPPKPAEAPRPTAEAARPVDAPKTRLELKPAAPAPEPAPAAPVAPPVATPQAATEAPAAVSAPRPAGSPTPPVDEVEARLRETARGCLAAYRTWRQQPGPGSIQSLSDAVHDLRKVLARIEIDMSASRRDEQVARPIPIPAHRAARRSP